MLKTKILIVDDSSTALMMTKMVLRNLGSVTIITAANGAEGVAKARESMPDVVLMDINMPVMDGIEATRRIRQDPVTRHIPIFMLTTRAEPEYVERGVEAGCDDYLTKPVEVPSFLRKLRGALNRRVEPATDSGVLFGADRLGTA